MDEFKCVMTIATFRFENIGTWKERKILMFGSHQFNLNCQNSYTLGKNLMINEKLVVSRRRCIPQKLNKYGVKVFVLIVLELLI